jgi:hypothetical protein
MRCLRLLLQIWRYKALLPAIEHSR